MRARLDLTELDLDREVLAILRGPAPVSPPNDLCDRVLQRLRAEHLETRRAPAARGWRRLEARAAIAFTSMVLILAGLQRVDVDLGAECAARLGQWATWIYAVVHGTVAPAVQHGRADLAMARSTVVALTNAAGLVATSNMMICVGLGVLGFFILRGVGGRTLSRCSMRLSRGAWQPWVLAAMVAVSGPPHDAHAVGEPRLAPRLDRADETMQDSSLSNPEPRSTQSRRESSRPAPRRKTAGYDMVKVGERIHIHADEIVRGDVVALGGDVRVEGEVTGNVVVVGGDLDAGPEALVGGQALALGGRVDAATGSNIEGGVVSLSMLPSQWFRDRERGRLARVGRILGQLLRLGVFLVGAAVLCAVFPRRIRRASAMMGNSFLRCFGLGVLTLTGGLFAVAVASVLLAITLVGIPLALLLACGTSLLLLGAWVVGAALVGARLLDAGGRREPPPFVAAATGLIVLLAPQLMVEILGGAANSPSFGMALRLAYTALILTVLATGLGAVLFSRLGSESVPTFETTPLGIASVSTSSVKNPHSI